jgi:hypothetical protein
MREFSLLNVPAMKISFQYWEWSLQRNEAGDKKTVNELVE